jgi:hypothetical protein
MAFVKLFFSFLARYGDGLHDGASFGGTSGASIKEQKQKIVFSGTPNRSGPTRH